MMFDERGLSPYKDPRRELYCDVALTVTVWLRSSGKDEEEAGEKARTLLDKILKKGDPKLDIIEDWDVRETEVEG